MSSHSHITFFQQPISVLSEFVCLVHSVITIIFWVKKMQSVSAETFLLIILEFYNKYYYNDSDRNDNTPPPFL